MNKRVHSHALEPPREIMTFETIDEVVQSRKVFSPACLKRQKRINNDKN